MRLGELPPPNRKPTYPARADQARCDVCAFSMYSDIVDLPPERPRVCRQNELGQPPLAQAASGPRPMGHKEKEGGQSGA